MHDDQLRGVRDLAGLEFTEGGSVVSLVSELSQAGDERAEGPVAHATGSYAVFAP